jgi:predicted transcriptional regulator of viral defense system
MATRLQIAKPDIVGTFAALPRVLKLRDIAKVFDENRAFWRLAQNTTLRAFIEFLVSKTSLKEARFHFPHRDASGFTWGDVPLMEVLLGLVDDSFFSHYTAVRIHGLTEQIPKTIYLNHEKVASSVFDRRSGPFEQTAIDKAFKQPPRASNNVVTFGDVRIVLLQSAYQDSLGITTGAVNYGGERDLNLRYTNLERTLIDIVVRPFYAGGVFEVAKAFENARDHVSVNTMASMLNRMQLGYPYHQSIGYYLERARYRPAQVDIFRTMPMERDFYLTHQMKGTTYEKRWRLHVPDGF